MSVFYFEKIDNEIKNNETLKLRLNYLTFFVYEDKNLNLKINFAYLNFNRSKNFTPNLVCE